jgi:hypothetical protein
MMIDMGHPSGRRLAFEPVAAAAADPWKGVASAAVPIDR